MGAAHMLGGDHQVTLFEAGSRLGGHARTVMAGKNGDQPVDTGFIVFNYANYPNLAALFNELDVPVVKSNMSFGASIDGGRLEYGLMTMDSIFAQRRNLANPKFLRMLSDILRFNNTAVKIAQDRSLTIREFLDRLGAGEYFRKYYLTPLSGAIWSTPVEKIMDFPAYSMIDFFENHALLSHTGQHQWYTVQGGSIEYVNRLEASMTAKGVEIRLNAAVQSVRRTPLGVEIKQHGVDWESFDEVIFATHSDDTLAMLADPNAQELGALGAVKYQPNDIILHADASIMPKRRKTWASWVYAEDRGQKSDRIDLTYWMNSLQPIPMDDLHFVTLNTKRPIREELIYDHVTLRHPVYDLEALAAQDQIQWLQRCTQYLVLRCVDAPRFPRRRAGQRGRCRAQDPRRGADFTGRRMTNTVDHIAGVTFHGRKGAVENAFRYSIDYVLLDAEAEVQTPALFARNKAGLTSLQDSDHGGPKGSGRGAAWVRDVLAGHQITGVAKIELIAQPRVLGHVFNPVSFWLCRRQDGGLIAVIAEVSNTFGDRHSYLCHHADLRDINPDDHLHAIKIFHVSPFQPVEGSYRFRFDIRADRVGIWIDYTQSEGGLIATLTGKRQPLTNAGILRSMLRRPFGARRVLALIHWQALKIWWKGGGYQPRPEPPAEEVSRG